MIVVKRGKEPNSLLKFRKENPDADYESDMPTDVLKDIREQMWEEQRCLCAYCMKTVSYTHLTLPTIYPKCRSRWSPYH